MCLQISYTEYEIASHRQCVHTCDVYTCTGPPYYALTSILCMYISYTCVLEAKIYYTYHNSRKKYTA